MLPATSPVAAIDVVPQNCETNDPHVPESRINEFQVILEGMGAKVIKKIYPGMGHTINHDELIMADLILNDKLNPKP